MDANRCLRVELLLDSICLIFGHYLTINLITSSALLKGANCNFNWCKKMKVCCLADITKTKKCACPWQVTHTSYYLKVNGKLHFALLLMHNKVRLLQKDKVASIKMYLTNHVFYQKSLSVHHHHKMFYIHTFLVMHNNNPNEIISSEWHHRGNFL